MEPLVALRRRLNGALALVVALVALGVWMAHDSARRIADTTHSVAEGRRFVSSLEEVLRLNVDAQTALRGWLLAGDEALLAPFRAARSALPAALDALAASAPGRAQPADIATLRRNVEAHLATRERLLQAADAGDIEAARASFVAAEGERLLRAVRSDAGRLKAAEELRLRRLEEESQAAAHEGLWSLGTLFLLTLLAIVAGHYLVQRQLAARLDAERALRDSEQRLEVTLRSIGEAVVAADTAGRVTGLNLAAEQLTGWMAAEAVGRPLADVLRLVDETTREALEAPVAAAAAQSAATPAAREALLRTRRDGELPIAVKSSPIRRSHGKLLGTVLVLRDVTEERRAAHAAQQLNEELERRVELRTAQLQAVNARLRLVDFTIEHAPVATYWIDRRAIILRANATAARLLGYLQNELADRSIAELDPVFPFERWDAIWDELSVRRVMTFESVHRHRDGTDIPVEIDVSRIAFEGADYNVAFARDMRERKRTEQELQRLNDELEQRVVERTAQLEAATRELGAKNIELAEASRLKSEFLANMSHELRTPLNSVLGFSELLLDGTVGPLDEQQRECVRDIHAGGAHLLNLINDILDLSKIEAGAMHLELGPVPLGSLLAGCVALVRERAMGRQLSLRSEVAADLGTMEGDARKIKQIAFNLLSNAIKFTPHSGTVELAARRVGRDRVDAELARAGRGFPPAPEAERYLEVSVRDTGIGIAPEALARLFEPFVQVDASLRRRHEGTGLGLALIKRIVDLHAGGLAVVSTPDAGSTFTVWLPWRDAAEPQPPLPPQRAGPIAPLALVIEDDEASARLLMHTLQGQGFGVLRAATAEEGLALARTRQPDLVMLDIFLPHIDGWQCLERLKRDPATAAIPVVIVTMNPDTRRGLALGAVQVLQKPLSHEALLGAIRDLGFAGPATGPVLVIDDDARAVAAAAGPLREAGLEVLCAEGGEEGIEMALRHRPALIVLDLLMPGVSGFDVVTALQADVQARSIPIVVVTAKRLGEDERRLLSEHVAKVMEKGSFGPEHLVGEVRRALRAGQAPPQEPA